MKILIFRTDPSIMNIATYNSQEIGLAKAYIALGHTCDIVYYNGGNPSRVEKIDAGNGKYINLYWRKGFSILNNGFFPGIGKLLRQYDMIQVSEYYFFASWYVYTFFSKTRRVYIYQGVYDSDNSAKYKLRCKIMDPILLHKRQLANTQVFTKSKLAQESMEKRGFQKVKTVGVGLDTTRFLKERNKLQENPLFQKDADLHYLLYIGVLEDRRNILFMLDVLKQLTDVDATIRLVLVGKGKDEYVSLCKNRVQELNLEKFIIYKERLPQEELYPIYRDSDLFLLPSKYEIFGMVLMEAMAFGVPVVSSANGGSSTLIKNGENGYIVDSFDVAAWSHTISEALASPNRLNIAQKASSVIGQNFTWQRIAAEILQSTCEDCI